MEVGRWKMEDGRWKMEDGSWKLEVGSWMMNLFFKTISNNLKPYQTI